MNEAQKRILIAKPGLDGHDRGAKIVVRALLDAGFDVIYTGLRQTPEAVAEIASTENVDVIGLSSMAGSHLDYCGRLKTELQDRKLTDKLWIIGGNIPSDDEDKLISLGLDGVFPVGSQLDDIVNFINEKLQ
jgi:methylmalonyl-CoA mutase C-terminal domain/subunit